MKKRSDTRILVLLAKMHDESEFWYPIRRLTQAGIDVVIAGEEADTRYKGRHGLPAKSDKAFAQVNPLDYEGMIIPGGPGPGFLCRSKACIRLVRQMFELRRMIAFICHAGLVPAAAGIIEGKRATSVTHIKREMIRAGCKWEDSALVVDDNLISSRDPDDLSEFVGGILSYLTASRTVADAVPAAL